MEKKITIFGAGVMGSGVAQLFAQHEFEVVLIDLEQSQLNRAKDTIARNLRYLELTKNLPVEHTTESCLNAIHFTTHLDSVKHTPYIIENITENWEKKKALYATIDKECNPACILGVNTSALSITKISALVTYPQRVVGVHFMNPAPMMPMVEVVKGEYTTVVTIDKIQSLLALVHKKMVVINDSVGFVSNRAMMLFINEAICILNEDIAAIETIDVIFKQCFGHKMGPLQTADLIGLDTVLFSLEILYEEFNDLRYQPSPLLKNMVSEGLLGEKTKKGFYCYE